MNKIISFFIGIMTLVVICIAMFFTGAIFDAVRRGTVETYFFQGNNFSYQRPGQPLSPKQMGDSAMFALLVKKYVTEYLYVLPEVADVTQRESDTGALHTMSNAAVFAEWKKSIAPEIRKMAEAGVLRTVSVGVPLKYGDFYQVEFKLKTWNTPNNMDEIPTTQNGIMQFKMYTAPYQPEISEEKLKTLHWAMDKGYDPVGVFNFGVIYVTIHME